MQLINDRCVELQRSKHGSLQRPEAVGRTSGTVCSPGTGETAGTRAEQTGLGFLPKEPHVGKKVFLLFSLDLVQYPG